MWTLRSTRWGGGTDGSWRRGGAPAAALVAALLGVLALAAPAAAQDPAPPPPPPPAAPAAPPPPELERSPRGAFLRSVAVPGWGQAWVGSPVRGGVYFAMEAGALWMTYKSHRKLREARFQEQWLRDSGQLAPGAVYGLSRARQDQVEDWLTLSIFLLFFSGADAFVAAHLADFGERVGGGPTLDGGARLQVTLPVGPR
jgi:hypothetical protein